jgi:hypothetical protein
MSALREQRAAAEALPHFRAGAGGPALPEGEVGIRIDTAGLAGSPGQRSWPLRGSFRVPRAAAGDSPETALQRIVLVLTAGSTHDAQARHAFTDELIFPDDVSERDGMVEGWFHLDLLRTFDFFSPFDTYFVVASLGPHVSGVLRRDVELPWLHQDPRPADDAEDDETEEPLEDAEEADDGGWEVDDPED